MNHVYRLVWNPTLQALVAVCESARGRGKSGGKAARTPTLLASFLIAAYAMPAGAIGLNTLPTGGQVSTGAASISSTANTLTVQQSTQKAAINWQSFSIGSGATVNFQQPNASSVILNRVVGTEQSVISGAMNANGQVFLLNSNGVLFTGTASVNVGGLVASTLNLNDADFMAGRNTFAANGSKASLINLGTITAADGGYVALLGKQVKNEGVITAKLGAAILAAGDQISLNFNGDSLVGVTIDQGTLNALVGNKHAIRADGGLVVLTAKGLDAVMATVVNNTGEIRAQTVANRDGKIYLLGEGGVVNVDGSLDASAPTGGNSGFIETSGPKVKIADSARITTASALGLNGSWLIDPVDFTIAATGGDITGTALSAALGAGSVTIQTATGGITCTGVSGCGAGTGTNGDIFVNEAVSWSANNTLTLNAHRNININQAITASGASGGVALHYGQGAVASGNAATYSFGLTSAGFAGKINLQAGNNFSTKLGSNGALTNWTVITALGNAADQTQAGATNSLQGLGHSSRLAGNFVLGANIDASGTSTWNTNAGFNPIGTYGGTGFSGRFDGLGHTVGGLAINRAATDGLGMFGLIASAGTVRNVGMTSVSVTGGRYYSGGLAGRNVGAISNSYASVLALNGSYGNGGLVGNNYGGTISNSHTTGAFTSTGSSNGGLVGLNSYGQISDSFSNVAVTVSGSTGFTGGLVGGNYGAGASITRSFATGNVTFNSPAGATSIKAIGGLVGQNQNASISASYATGSVTVAATSIRVRAGGLVGQSFSNFGGTVSLTNSYATGDVTNGTYGSLESATGGLIGYAYGGTITNTYAAGRVTGFAGFAEIPAIPPNIPGTPYSLEGGAKTGGLVGTLINSGARTATLTNSFYDSTLNPGLTGLGAAFSDPGAQTTYAPVDVAGKVEGKSTANLKTLATFSGTSPAWDIVGSDGSYPQLRWAAGVTSGSSVWVMASPSSPIYIRLTDGGSSLYGSTPGFGYAYYTTAGGSTAVTDATPTGSVVWSGAPTSTSNAGLYSLTYSSGITLGNSAYTLSPGSAVSWTVNPAPLTVTASNASKVYGQIPTLSNFTSSGLQNSETIGSVSLSSSGTAVTAGVTGSPYSIIASAASGGSFNPVNYSITYSNGGLTVLPLAIAVAANTGATRVYDGSANATASLLNVTNAINGDTVTLGGNATLADSNVGAQVLVSMASLTVGNPNYTVVGGTTSGNVAVSAAPLSVTANNASKVYGQTPTLNGFTSSGLVAGQTIGSVTETSTGTAATAGVTGSPYAIVASDATGGTFTPGNYNISYVNGALTVTPLAVAVATNSGATRVYDGTSVAAASLLNVTNAINGDTVTLGGNATLADSNVGAQVLVSMASLTVGNPNYTVVGGTTSGNVAVSAAPLSVTANNASKVYGQTPTLNGFTSSGLVAGQTIGSVTETSTGTAATAGVTGSPYAIVASDATGGTFTPGNYNISYVNGALTVTPLAVAVATNSGATRVYDGTSVAAASLLSVTNAINGDTVTLGGTATLAGSNVGAEAVISTAGLTANNPNYTVVGGTTAGTVMITLPQSVIANTTAQVPSNRNATNYPSLTLPAQVSTTTVAGDRPADSTFNVVNPLPQISAVFGANTALTVISSPNANEPSQAVSLSQVRNMLQSASQGGITLAQAGVPQDVRVPVSRNSLADIVNGGVRLPDGVEQELFVVQAN